MKRLLVFLVSASLALCVGCSAREETNVAPNETASPTESASPPEGGLPALEEVEPVVVEYEYDWSKRVGREDENLTAQELSFEIELAEPAALDVSCETESGTLDMKIQGPDGKSVFDQKDLQTGEYEADAPAAGTYTVTVRAEGHTGSFWITPRV